LSGVARVDVQGAALAGSQLQTQLWVNRRADQLNHAIGTAIPQLSEAAIEWRSPLVEDHYREYQDRDFLKRLGLADHADSLAAFWPTGGPVWDGLAAVEVAGVQGAVLVEGKSYPAELFGSGCQASPQSRERIEAALADTQEWVGLERDPKRWCGRLYQSANRLAHVYWLREIVGVPAWLVHLLFTGDPHGPTTAEEWAAAMTAADAELGLTEPVNGAAHVVLEAGTREELLGQSE
jgi:hypothetical protein